MDEDRATFCIVKNVAHAQRVVRTLTAAGFRRADVAIRSRGNSQVVVAVRTQDGFERARARELFEAAGVADTGASHAA